MKLPWHVNARCSMAGFDALRRRVGLPRALFYCILALAGGDPFRPLPLPKGSAETLSRRQIASAVGLYTVLKSRLGAGTAIGIMRDVVTTATQTFLSWAVGRPDPAAFRDMPPEERLAFASAITGKFFNATGRLGDVSGDSFDFTVERCLFRELCSGAGVPELAPLFCEGDLLYFTAGLVRLDRSVTLAVDDRPCDFRFSMKAAATDNGKGRA